MLEKKHDLILNSWLKHKELLNDDFEIIKSFDESHIIEAFYKHVDFGTGGIRAKMGLGSNLLNIYTISRISLGIANYLNHHNKDKIVLGYDTRNNSHLFSTIASNVLLSKGIKVFTFQNYIPTPVLSFAVQHLNLDLGIMITASHNPPIYNGYKIYDHYGCQLVPHQAIEIKKFVDALPDFVAPIQSKFKPNYIDFIKIDYLKMIDSLRSHNSEMTNKLKVAFTSLHGTGYEYAKPIIQYEHEFIEVPHECKPDGNFSNIASSNPEDNKSFEGMRTLFGKNSFDIGFATDPDADRLGVLVNHRGSLIPLTGNQVGALLTNYLIKHKNTQNSYIVTTIVSSDLAKNIANNNKIKVIQTLTGFKYIGEQIEINKDKDFLFGYEESFGFLLDPRVRDKDAFQPIPLILDYVSKLKKVGKSLLDELENIFQQYGYFQEELITFTYEGLEGQKKIINTINLLSRTQLGPYLGLTISEIENYQTLKKVTIDSITDLTLDKSDVIKFRFKEGGWVVFRPSGTEPKLKIYLSLKGNNKHEVSSRIGKFKEKLIASL
jgi:phosphoglucomutase